MSASRVADRGARGLSAGRDGSPAGLHRLILFQFWDILAFYGSRVLIVLYLIDMLARPASAAEVWGLTPAHDWAAARLGLRSDQAFVSAVFGLFGAVANVTPVIGGWLSDRFVTRRGAVIAGSLLMAAGHAMLASQAPFLVGLMFLACGNGFYRGTSGAMLANLFRRNDPRVAGAFQLSYAASNMAAVVAPLICGTLGELVGWSWGFAAAAIAMLVGLATLLSIPGALLAEPRPTPRSQGRVPSGAIGPRLLLIAGVAMFMIGNEQLSNAMVVWLKQSVDRGFGGTRMPLTWFFGLSPLAITLSAVLLARKPPGDGAPAMRRRIVRGSLVGGCAWALLAVVAMAGRVPAMAVILFLLVWGTAFALVLPSGAALMAELTPQAARGRWLGVYYLMAMIASLAVGALGGLYGRMSHPAFIACHAAIIFAGAGLLASLNRLDRAAWRR